MSDIIFGVLITVALIVSRYFMLRILNKTPKDERRKLLKMVLNSALLLVFLFSLSALCLKNFFEIELFQTKFFHFSAPHIFYVLLILLSAFFSTRLITALILHEDSKSKPALTVKRKGILFIKYLIWIIGLILILKITLLNPSKPANFELINIKDVAISVFDLIFFTIIVSVTGLALVGLKEYFRHQSDTKKIDPGNAAALYKIIKYVLWVLAVILGLQSAGFNLSLILAGSAALLVGFGIGIQNIFADIVSGFILLLERPLKATDIIEVDGIVGKVKNIGIRTTTLYTRDDTVIRVPNSKFTAEKIINWSDVKFNTRFRVDVGVAYGSDVEKVMRIMKQCAEEHKEIDKYPEPFVRFENFGDSALSFSLFFWSDKNMTIENIKSDLRVAIDREFRSANIKIPFPQRDIHIISK